VKRSGCRGTRRVGLRVAGQRKLGVTHVIDRLLAALARLAVDRDDVAIEHRIPGAVDVRSKLAG
jgi:hypothetical protein